MNALGTGFWESFFFPFPLSLVYFVTFSHSFWHQSLLLLWHNVWQRQLGRRSYLLYFYFCHIYLFIVCVGMCICVPGHTCGGWSMTCKNQLFSSTMWIRSQTQTITLGANLLHPSSPFSGPGKDVFWFTVHLGRQGMVWSLWLGSGNWDCYSSRPSRPG